MEGCVPGALPRSILLANNLGQLLVRVVAHHPRFGPWESLAEMVPMLVGPLLFGFYLAFLARKTDSVRWPMPTSWAGW